MRYVLTPTLVLTYHLVLGFSSCSAGHASLDGLFLTSIYAFSSYQHPLRWI